ncbi:tetrapyrrole methylase family protein [Mariprofundus ferrinatatus]|uniref:Tetrapyrrole methylase family protein n=1 Tax=Mariprofundus ferrinatatus TaxID=1921087 RepID=A0A2K8L3Q6_9PROT|nr:nucleoside triphosphate pyrophosphohydrolase [Mariprofundus ferrinatatus]ATX81965.1 tetrapyrrole methylase family protein [Mariprofundus ferrinatatus]
MPERIRGKDNYYDKLYALMKVLREECPWDKEQTLLSLRRYTLEEVHEVLEAIELAESDNNWQPLKAELGDLLIQVLFYSRIAEEAGEFNLADVIDALIDKMIYRHPHVFDKADPDDLTDQWNRLKDAEHKGRKSLMDEIPPLPALKYAQKQQQRAARVGFDWVKATDVLAKMREELEELEHEVTHHGDLKRIEDEFGDVLFTLTNLARKLNLDAELCLMSTNRKFAERFKTMELLADQKGISLDELDIDQQETLYQEAKKLLI